MPPESVTADQRRIAKAINFGLVFGQQEFGLAQVLRIPVVGIPSLDLVISRNGGQADPNSTPGVRAWNDDNWNGDVKVLEPFLNPIVQATTP